MRDHPEPGASDWGTRRVLVTGAGGFVGSWLARSLAEKRARVFALVRSSTDDDLRLCGVEVCAGTVTDLACVSDLITRSGIDTVFHMAASNVNTGAGVSPYDLFESNIRGVYTVLEACRTAPQRVMAVIASSKEVEDCFSAESSRRHHPYMCSKAAAELISKAYNQTFQVPSALVRSDNLYGGGDLNWSRLVPATMRAMLSGEVPLIRSNGLLERDYVYIEDAVAAYLAIGERGNDPEVIGKTFRIATGVGTSVLEVVREVIRVAGATGLEPRVLNEASEERIDTIYQPVTERRVLGWSARYSLEQGLRRTFDWYKNFLQRNPAS